MIPVKTLPILGSQVEVLISSEMTEGRSVTLMEISPPGGGPPPHMHQNEDETFHIVEGEYEFLVDGAWVRGQAKRFTPTAVQCTPSATAARVRAGC